MDAQKWNESLDQIESSIAWMIDILKNRPRFPTAPPPKVPQPPPISAIEPLSVSPPYVVASPPKQVLVAVTPPPKTTPDTRFTTSPPPTSPPVRSPPLRLTSMAASTPVFSPSLMNTASTYIKNVLTPRTEWRPPWRLVETAPNAIGRVEWRPPWYFLQSLRTRTFPRARE
ncbi:hypothetical protein Hanom_Chr01g00034111 [Helianthus anomalus]